MNSNLKNQGYSVLSIALVMTGWQIASSFLPPVVLPSVPSTLQKLLDMIADPEMLRMILITSKRLFAGLLIGLSAGVGFGILTGKSKLARQLILPIIGILQTVPPISWLVLALIWFGFNGKPSVFILVLSVLPIIAINVSEGFQRIDPGLIEMAKIYKFSRSKVFFHIVTPSVLPYFKSGCMNALGLGWKIAVMGEVLTTTDGIGGMLQSARLNLETDAVMAWSILILLLFYLTRWLLERLFQMGERYDIDQTN